MARSTSEKRSNVSHGSAVSGAMRKKDTVTTATLNDIGGLHDEVRRIREIIELPTKQPELTKRMGVDIPRGILLYGPQGTGKTLAVKVLAKESGVDLFTIKWSHVMAMSDDASMSMLNDAFAKARESAPSLLLIDDMESMGYDQSPITDLVRKKSAQLIYALDSLSESDEVIVIGITDKLSTIDPNLKKHRRLGAKIEFRVPDEAGRKGILEIRTRSMPLENVNIDHVAKLTVGFMGADIAALCREATMCALRRHIPDSGLAREVPKETVDKIRITESDFQLALRVLGKK